MRRLLLLILIFGLVGTDAELLLLQHTKSLWELIPVVLIGTALVIVMWHAIAWHAASIRAMQGVMGLFLLAGVAGIALQQRQHFILDVLRLGR